MINTDFNIYGFVMLISFLSGILIIIKNCYDKEYNVNEIVTLVIYLFIGFILGGKIYSYFSGNYEKFEFMKLGLSSLGSLIGAFIVLIIYKFQFNKKIEELLYILLPSVVIMYAIGKIGCFFTGCCLGLKYTGLGNIVYHYSNHVTSDYSYFPIQIIESIIFFIVFIYLFVIKRNKDYNVFKITINCFWIKFILDFFRLNHEVKLISFNQITCLVCIILIYLFLALKSRKSLHK